MNRFLRITKTLGLGLGLAAAIGCSDDDDPMPQQTPDSGVMDPDSGMDPGGATSFTVRFENVSGSGPLPGPISPGVVLAHTDAAPLFTAGMADRDEGLAAIAEDGDPSTLAGNLSDAVVFNTPVGANGPGPAFPGDAYEVEVMAEPGQNLNFATMLVQTNDVILAPGEAGIPLFDAQGTPLAERDITDMVSLWDVGSEANEAPGVGPNQAPRQPGPDTGGAEGVVRRFSGSTHALPLPAALIGVDVTESGGTYTVTLTNTAPTSGTLLSPFSPGVYALHASSASIFTDGGTASPGLELLAEDGDPSLWATELAAIDGVSAATFGTGPVMGGDSVSFDATPTMDAPILSFGTMVIATNDAFFALPPSGINLLDSNGAARPAGEVQAEIRSRLAIWDAGTEIDQIPGVGPDQPQRGGADTGAADPNAMVRRHADTTNFLANIADVIDVSIAETGAGSGQFDVTIQVTAAGVTNGFPILTPVAWAVHSDATGFFTPGMPASAAIESIAEDGNPMMLAQALSNDAEVGTSGVAGDMPFMPGMPVMFTVTPTMDAPYLSFATMIVPSNDLFLAFGREGVRLLETDGTARPQADIEADIAAALAVWDAGTEQNQSGAGGSDQAPRGMPNTGEAEGDATVRAMPDGVWIYPTVAESVRITVRPTN